MKTRVANKPLAELLDQHTVVGSAELCIPEDGRIRCLACGHRCLIGEGLRGICKVRFNTRDSSRFRSATLPACNAIQSRRSRSFMSTPAAMRLLSA